MEEESREVQMGGVGKRNEDHARQSAKCDGAFLSLSQSSMVNCDNPSLASASASASASTSSSASSSSSSCSSSSSSSSLLAVSEPPIKFLKCSATDAQGVVSKKAASLHCIAQVIPSLKLRLSIGEDESNDELSLELNIGSRPPQPPPSAKRVFKNERPGRPSGFSKWKRPSSQEGTGTSTRCFELSSCWPMKMRYKAQASTATEQMECRSEDDISDLCGEAYGKMPRGTLMQTGTNKVSLLGLPISIAEGCQEDGSRLHEVQTPLTHYWLGMNNVAPTPSTTALLLPNNIALDPPDSPHHLLAKFETPTCGKDYYAENGDGDCKGGCGLDPREGSRTTSLMKMKVDINGKDSDEQMETDDVSKCAMVISKTPVEIPSIQDASLVEYLRAKKLQKDHFLDKVIVNEDVYSKHPWNHRTGEVRGYLYFCCNTKYSMRGNMTRDRMTKEGGRWKQQGMVHPILNVREEDAALKTYMSYIPCGKNTLKDHFVPKTPGRVKHRHRMIEIALEEDLKLEKMYFKCKVPPHPFLVVCVVKKA